jgi:hypothetical protein
VARLVNPASIEISVTGKSVAINKRMLEPRVELTLLWGFTEGAILSSS